MERITFVIESTNQTVTCLMNPEDRDRGFTLERSSGLSRKEEGSAFAGNLSDSPVQTRGRGDTRLTLKLLFDTDLELSTRPNGTRDFASPGQDVRNLTRATRDVRDLTRPLWDLTEYAARSSGPLLGLRTGAAGAQRDSRSLPRVHVIWGKGWDIPAMVESVAESYERFTEDGLPQRSWVTLRLLRVPDEIPPAELPPRDTALTLPEPGEFAARTAAEGADEHTWGVHELLGGGTQGDQLWQLAARYYGDPRLWRLIALANDIADPLSMAAGALLKVPPLSVLARPGTRRSR